MTHTSFSAPIGAVIGLPLAVRVIEFYSLRSSKKSLILTPTRGGLPTKELKPYYCLSSNLTIV